MNKRSGKESKQKIIDAAMTVFSAKGYAKASIREIAKTAGISIGGVYLYFRNKEELYKCLIQKKRHDLERAIEITAKKNVSASKTLADFLGMYLDYAIKHKEFILLHIREHGFTFGMDEKRKFFRKQRHLIERIIQRGIQSGEFRQCNARDMAKIIMGSLRGVVLSIALDDIAITPKMLKEVLLNGLLSSRGRG